ncbi:ribonuclease P protein component [Sphingopyxis sp. H050]|uniref:ribonuclease P protein component n=1 Tax=Sphingopyxis sp. H050 TaxID=1759072 RepID=UPI000736D6EF|nr:ribonuclease P protein component [Sphingopyxis sp. H050]KTE19369.1 ribonuclease P protein component [Sphingopyxis sp. H050]
MRTLSKRSEFLAANRGLRFPMPGFVLLVRLRDDGDDQPGIGFTVSKKVGNAVTRNRMKRRLRALARTALPESGIAGADHVLIGRPGGNDIAFADLGEHLDSALKRAAKKLATSP